MTWTCLAISSVVKVECSICAVLASSFRVCELSSWALSQTHIEHKVLILSTCHLQVLSSVYDVSLKLYLSFVTWLTLKDCGAEIENTLVWYRLYLCFNKQCCFLIHFHWCKFSNSSVFIANHLTKEVKDPKPNRFLHNPPTYSLKHRLIFIYSII
jgi:hypothetical protein